MADRVLLFTLAGGQFALPAADIRECLPLPRLRRRPGLPPAVAGFFSFGGTTLPVLDLARLLGLRAGPAPSSASTTSSTRSCATSTTGLSVSRGTR